MPEADSSKIRGSADVPALLLLVAGLVALIGCSMSVAGAIRTGIFADDPAHVDRLTQYFHSGLYVTGDELANAPAKAIPDNAYVYGPVATGLVHEVNVMVGNERPGQVERTPNAYLVRHLVVAGLAILGMVLAGLLGSIVLGSWRWGVVVAGILAAIPLWTGHAMFNVKDVPVAVGNTLITLGLVLLAGWSERGESRRPVLGSIALMTGVVLMLGIRPGMWVSLAVSLVIFVGIVIWTGSFRWPLLAAMVCASVAGYVALVGIYPRVFAHPLTMLWRSATASADFPFGDPAGRLYQLDQMGRIWPLILLAFLCIGVVAGTIRSVRLLRQRSDTALAWLLIAAQSFALPFLIAVHNSPLINGLRQTLFAVPTQAVLVAAGIAATIHAARSSGSRALTAGASVIVVLGLIAPTAAQLRMFPYQYSQLNVVGTDTRGTEPNPRYAADLDYAKTSFRELVPVVSPTVKVVCPRWLEPGELARRDEADCRTRLGGTFSAFWRFDGRSSTDRPQSDEFYALVRGAMHVPPNCHTVHAVTRWQNLKRVTLSRLIMCRPAGD